MRRWRLKKLWRHLHEPRWQKLNRDEPVLKLGAAKKEAGHAHALVAIQKRLSILDLSTAHIPELRKSV